MNHNLNNIAHKINQAIAAMHERRYLDRQRFLALEARFKEISNSNISYVNLNGISVLMPRV